MGETPAEMTTPVADKLAQVSRTSERRYFRILDIAFDGIISIDGAQRIIDFNQGAERIFGHGADEVIGKSIDILLPSRFREQHGGHIRNFATSGETKRMMAARGNIVGVRKDGSEFPAEASISKSMAGGEPEFTVILRDITDRMKVQDSLAESEARYRSLVEFSPDAILVQIDGRIVFANPAAAIVYGAQSPEDLVDIAILDLLHPDEKENHFHRLAEVTSKKRPLRIQEQRRLRIDGTEILVETRGIPFSWRGRLAILGVSRDISHRKRQEEALRESEERHRSVIDISPNAIWVVGDGLVVFANNSMATLVGAGSPDELVGREALDFTHRADRDLILERRRLIIDEHQKAPWIEHRIVRMDGADVEVESHGTRIVWDARPSALVVFRDLTERRSAEAASREKETALRELERKLADLSRSSAVGEWSSVLAHELNQPLAAIVNYLEAGRQAINSTDASRSGKADEMMFKALRQASRATDIFHNMREIGSRDTTARSEEDINDVVSEVSSIGLIGAEEKGVEARLEFNLALPKVLVNKIQIQQVVLNLLRNGMEAMADRDNRRIVVTTSMGEEEFVNVTVADTGAGLPDEIRARLFEPFVTTKPNGMGLGLAICRSIVEAHGGKLSAAPNPDGGTIFLMALPFAARAG